MPRYKTQAETSNKTAVWSTRTINVQNSHNITAGNTFEQQQNVAVSAKVGRMLAVYMSIQYKCDTDANNQTRLHGYATTGAVVGSLSGGQNTAWQTLTNWFGLNPITGASTMFTGSNIGQSDIASLYFRESGTNTNAKYARVHYTTNRTHRVYYTYEHKCGGAPVLSQKKIGGAHFAYVKAVGGRSQISGDGDYSMAAGVM